MEIAVLGGGNGSHAAAADLADQGHHVRFWRRDGAALRALQEAGSITLKDFRGTRAVSLGLVTNDLGAAVRGVELIVIPTPAFAQADIAQALAPHLMDGQALFLPPGTFGSYVMMVALRDAGSRADVAIGESGTLPWLTRKHGPGTIAITTRATRLPTGIFPARLAERGLGTIRNAFPAIEPVEDALSAALMNAGPIIHPPLILMNAGPLEHFPEWDIHKEGTQPSIRRVTDALDAERIAVREALGYGRPHFPLADHYSRDGEEWMYGNLAHEKLTDSGDWREKIELTRHRYMLEDVRLGLALLVSVADWVGVAAPVACGLLAVGSAVVGEDFRATGRTLENLGLAARSREAMATLLREGLKVTAKALIGALGAGRMGRGIALVFAYAGHRCTLIDIKPRDAAALEKLRREAFAAIDANLQALEAAQVLDAGQRRTILARVDFAGREAAPAALVAVDVLFEGVPERLEAKREAFEFVGRHVRADTIVASTTSTILSNDLAPFVARPGRFLNAHWLNPAFIIPLVELSPADATAPETVTRMKALLDGIGKVPVVCKPSPGFIVPRIQALAMNEAARLVEEGVASVEDIDKATRYGLGFRFAVLGVLEFIDWGGGDILYYASRYLAEATGQDRYAAPPIIDRNMREGRIGMGSGQGFYDFDAMDIGAYQRERLARFVGLLRHLDLLRPPG